MQGHAKAEQGLTRVFSESFAERCSSNSALRFDLDVFRCVVEPPTQICPNDADRDPEQEGQSPSPGETLGLRQEGVEYGRRQGAEQKTAANANKLP